MEPRFGSKWSVSKTFPLKYFTVLSNQVCSVDVDSTASRLLKVLNPRLNGLNVFLCLFPTIMNPATHISLTLHNFNTDTPENPHLLNVSEIHCRRMIPCVVCKRSQRRKELKSKSKEKLGEIAW